MDYDRLTNLLESEDIAYAEINTYHVGDDGRVTLKTTHIDYYGDDYQWSTSVKPIVKR